MLCVTLQQINRTLSTTVKGAVERGYHEARPNVLLGLFLLGSYGIRNQSRCRGRPLLRACTKPKGQAQFVALLACLGKADRFRLLTLPPCRLTTGPAFRWTMLVAMHLALYILSRARGDGSRGYWLGRPANTSSCGPELL